jgi:GT2 family glycosyltransferase
MSETPLVSVIIPHFNGPEILERCLTALQASTYPAMEVVLVDNASHDGSALAAAERFASLPLRLIRLPENRGFAGGCNAGVREAHGRYVALLNNDAVVPPRWLDPLVALAEADDRIAAVQPKVRSIDEPECFDYAAAAGGLLDVLGYPFARGRIFYTCERDTGQYDTVCELFWASGTCCLVRRDTWERAGGFDESFFAHMEEIDLNWRFHLSGLRVLFCPDTVVLHHAGTTLPPENPRKMFLNHRNGLMMLLKNCAWPTLVWVMPVRLALELVAAVHFLVRGDRNQTRGILMALWAVGTQREAIVAGRRRAQAVRAVSDAQVRTRMYRGSVVWDYFVRGRRTCGALEGRASRAREATPPVMSGTSPR